MLDNIILGLITQSSFENTRLLWVCAKFSKCIQNFANFTIEW